MITRIREVRKAKRLTLHEVAARCQPPTTAQTIGRLETGLRTVSVSWLNRIAKALGVEPSELVTLPDRADVPVAAVLRGDGVTAPPKAAVLLPPAPSPAMVGLKVEVAQGDYRTGDQLWLERLEPTDYAKALNRDVLVPRSAGRFAFGRLAATAPDKNGARVQLLPLTPGARQQVIPDAPWIAVARVVVREL
jgi:transcriptional regulator with XRE-family HTH domain